MYRLIVFLIPILCFSCKTTVSEIEQKIIDGNYKTVQGELTVKEKEENVDRFPLYPNGQKGIVNHLKKNFYYPKEAKEKGIQGLVIIEYIVEKDGRVLETRIVKSAGEILDSAATDIILKMDNWIPAYKNGKPVRCSYKLPIRYKLN